MVHRSKFGDIQCADVPKNYTFYKSMGSILLDIVWLKSTFGECVWGCWSNKNILDLLLILYLLPPPVPSKLLLPSLLTFQVKGLI